MNFKQQLLECRELAKKMRKVDEFLLGLKDSYSYDQITEIEDFIFSEEEQDIDQFIKEL